jgi:hypothetical protein
MVAVILLLAAFAVAAETAPPLPAPDEIVRHAVSDGERFWRGANRQPPSVGSRDLFGYALALCEAIRVREDGTAIDRLFITTSKDERPQ